MTGLERRKREGRRTGGVKEIMNVNPFSSSSRWGIVREEEEEEGERGREEKKICGNFSFFVLCALLRLVLPQRQSSLWVSQHSAEKGCLWWCVCECAYVCVCVVVVCVSVRVCLCVRDGGMCECAYVCVCAWWYV